MKPEAKIIKKCKCGKVYSKEMWDKLLNCKIWPDDSADEGMTLEQRDCSCSSSLAITIKNPKKKCIDRKPEECYIEQVDVDRFNPRIEPRIQKKETNHG